MVAGAAVTKNNYHVLQTMETEWGSARRENHAETGRTAGSSDGEKNTTFKQLIPGRWWEVVGGEFDVVRQGAKHQ